MESRVLVIDTDPGALRETATLLERKGFEVVRAASFQQVHEAICDEAPPVVVIEPVLDGIDGFELCRAIRQVYPAYRPAVFIASRRIRGASPETKTRAVGAQAFLERPGMDVRLVREIDSALRAGGPASGSGLPAVVAAPTVEASDPSFADAASAPDPTRPRARHPAIRGYLLGLVSGIALAALALVARGRLQPPAPTPVPSATQAARRHDPPLVPTPGAKVCPIEPGATVAPRGEPAAAGLPTPRGGDEIVAVPPPPVEPDDRPADPALSLAQPVLPPSARLAADAPELALGHPFWLGWPVIAVRPAALTVAGDAPVAGDPGTEVARRDPDDAPP